MFDKLIELMQSISSTIDLEEDDITPELMLEILKEFYSTFQQYFELKIIDMGDFLAENNLKSLSDILRHAITHTQSLSIPIDKLDLELFDNQKQTYINQLNLHLEILSFSEISESN